MQVKSVTVACWNRPVLPPLVGRPQLFLFLLQLRGTALRMCPALCRDEDSLSPPNQPSPSQHMGVMLHFTGEESTVALPLLVWIPSSMLASAAPQLGPPSRKQSLDSDTPVSLGPLQAEVLLTCAPSVRLSPGREHGSAPGLPEQPCPEHPRPSAGRLPRRPQK